MPEETSALRRIDKEALKQLLLRGWMTHDAMWFASAVERLGIEEANELNLSAIRAMAPIEVRRLLGALGMEGVESFEDLERFLTGALELVGGDFMAFVWDFRPPDVLAVRVDSCFAHQGLVRLGAIDRYRCGIFERIYAWLDALAIPYERPAVPTHCTLHHDGACARELRFRWPEAG